MAILVWITLTVKDGNSNQVLELLDSPEGNDFTASQQGCERLERSVDHDNPNQILLTELWSSKEDWDAYFEMQQEVRDNNGFNKQILELIEENGIEIKFSEVNKSKRSKFVARPSAIFSKFKIPKWVCGSLLAHFEMRYPSALFAIFGPTRSRSFQK